MVLGLGSLAWHGQGPWGAGLHGPSAGQAGFPRLPRVLQAQGQLSAGAAGRLNPAAVKQQLRALIAKLDSVLPYLTLAISAVGLLSSGARGLQHD